jgi:hypothetical protein
MSRFLVRHPKVSRFIGAHPALSRFVSRISGVSRFLPAVATTPPVAPVYNARACKQRRPTLRM